MRVDGRGTRELEQTQATYLEKLADELSHRGLEAWLMAPPGRVPSLYVVNPAARALEENVYAGCGKDGIWWFWWSWAERIAVADDVDLAATTIVRVLASLRHGDLLGYADWGDPRWFGVAGARRGILRGPAFPPAGGMGAVIAGVTGDN